MLPRDNTGRSGKKNIKNKHKTSKSCKA